MKFQLFYHRRQEKFIHCFGFTGPESEEEFKSYLTEYLLLSKSGQGFIKDIKFSSFPFGNYNITVSFGLSFTGCKSCNILVSSQTEKDSKHPNFPYIRGKKEKKNSSKKSFKVCGILGIFTVSSFVAKLTGARYKVSKRT